MLVGYLKLDPHSSPFIDERLGIKIMPGQVAQVDLSFATISIEKSIAMGQLLPATADEYRQFLENGLLEPVGGETPQQPPQTPIIPQAFSDGFSDGFQ